MVKLEYRVGGGHGEIRFHNPRTGKKIVDSIDLLKWEVLKTHIDSISSNSTSLTYIKILEGERIVANSDSSEREIIGWSNLDITLWDAIKAEIEAL